MPVQIQNDVDAVYEPIITIADTGEVLTEAQIYDTTLALANRIEFVRQATDTLTEEPEAYYLFREDFSTGVWDGVSNIYAENTWTISEGGDLSHTIGSDSAYPDNPGQLQVAVVSGDTWAADAGSVAAIPFGDIQQLTIVAAINSTNLNDQELFFGLAADIDSADVGASAVGLWFDQGTNANWLTRHKTNGVDDATISAVPAVDDAFVVWKMTRISSTQVRISINGTTTATLTQGTNAPDAADLVVLGAYANNTAGGVTLRPRWDFVSMRVSTPNRAT